MKSKKRDPNSLDITPKEGIDSKEELIASTVLDPNVQAAAAIQQYDKDSFSGLGITELVVALNVQSKAIENGELGRAETMLTAQAHTLDSIFSTLAKKAINAEYMDNFDRYLKLALKAQSQCRATWEAVSAIKYPPVANVVRQANISHGPQQVNNRVTAGTDSAQPGKNQNRKNKLLEKKEDGEWLDIGTTGTAGRVDQGMATMGKVNRAENAGR